MAHGSRLGLLFLVVTTVGCQNSQKAPLSSLPPLPPPKALADRSNPTQRAAAPADTAGRRDTRTSAPAVPASSTGRPGPLAADTGDANPFGSSLPAANPASFRQGFPNPRPNAGTPAASPAASASVTGLPAPDGLKNPLPPEPNAAPPIPTPQPPGPPAGSGGFPVAAPSSGLVMPEKLGEK